MRHIRFPKQTAIVSLNNINRLIVFAKETYFRRGGYLIFKYYLDKLPAVELTSTFLHGAREPNTLTVRTTEVPPEGVLR